MATVPSQFPPREARSIEQYQAEVLGLVRPDSRVEPVHWRLPRGGYWRETW